MQILKKNGITLVALIITIIILLILAGVSLSFVFNGGILDKSQQAVNEYENASQIEQDLLDKIDKYLENELGEIANDEPKVPSVDENGLATEDTIIVAVDDEDIQKDSRSWGNYSNSVGGAEENSGGSSKPSGTNEYWKANNIYDLAGNVWEWTQEKYSIENIRYSDSGGAYTFEGNNCPAAHRDNDPYNSMRDDERF